MPQLWNHIPAIGEELTNVKDISHSVERTHLFCHLKVCVPSLQYRKTFLGGSTTSGTRGIFQIRVGTLVPGYSVSASPSQMVLIQHLTA